MKTCSIEGCARAYYAKGLCQTDYRRQYNTKNRDKSRRACLKYVSRNRESVYKKFRAHIKNNPAKFIAARAKRRAMKKLACPQWTDLAAIREIYKTCPPGHHVDHIIPLSHPQVCGLHVPWNLQHLPAAENIRKHNKLLEEYCRVEASNA